ncbi:4-hydroxyphenylpyruvate dioxygenase [Chloracidobacterium thermophilum]|uniref:4-hydroxyphenylpyruvate dioxygenase n=1 Tax=Chloracidobacterium thermophilum (strain B) TaxID=981222 RepID=G2LJ27_CHLTF|nr:4-hydroxyphenylpyruvate dioxygenase [Chloracidobacterium thermophilum]AEP12795.1 4-hydroxyphenylpyruvate dioxygenase [Chloracidobacterium thermophilum B]QUV78524.1 4-hydroxyphenylpyruvate dioxygenase [Chloracidobacterium thermophilum]
MSAPKEATRHERAPLAVADFDHVEFYVGNAKQAAHFYRTAFGFDIVAYRGPETGVHDCVSYALQHGTIRLVVTGALTPDHPVAEHVRRHGDGVQAVAFRTPDVVGDFTRAVERGATAHRAPETLRDDHGIAHIAEIAAYGDTIHRFVGRDDYTGPFLPGFVPRLVKAPHTGFLHRIDHVVANVGWHQMETWVKFYEDIFGFFQFRHFDEKDISTEYTALRSKVMASANLAIKLPINEPAEGKKRSQIEEYVDFYGSPGVQHIAIATPDIIGAVSRLRDNGVELQSVPATYYDTITERVGNIEEDLAVLRDLNILIDRDDQGYLLQIFTKPVQDRPTVFFEIIQRKGSESFGKGNFKALFEAIERDQAARGTL